MYINKTGSIYIEPAKLQIKYENSKLFRDYFSKKSYTFT